MADPAGPPTHLVPTQYGHLYPLPSVITNPPNLYPLFQTNMPVVNSSINNFIPIQTNTSSIYPTQFSFHSTSMPLLTSYNTNQQFNLCPPSDPLNFRQPNQRNAQYVIPSPSSFSTQSSGLKNLQGYLNLCLNGFNPCELNLAHPIHAELMNLCNPILQQCKSLSLDKKIEYLSKTFIPEIVSGSNDSTGIQPTGKFELLEIALRYHLYLGLIEQEKAVIKGCYEYNNQKKLPDDLDKREILLHQFVTSNNVYFNPYPDMYTNLTKDIIHPHLTELLAKKGIDLPLDKSIPACEKFIAEQLRSLQLVKQSVAASNAELHMRSDLTQKMVTKLAAQYKKGFHETGTVNSGQLNHDSSRLWEFISKNGQFSTNWNVMMQLLAESFELQNTPHPFVAVRDKVTREETAQLTFLSQEKKSWFSNLAKTSEQKQREIKALARKKIQTITEMEREWNAIQNPPSAIIPSAPLMDPNPIATVSPVVQAPAPLPTQQPVLQTNLPPPPPLPIQTITAAPPQTNATVHTSNIPSLTAGDKEIPIISYIDIAFEDLLKKNSYQEKWEALPIIAQKDVMRHVIYQPRLKGEAEDTVRHLFGTKIHQLAIDLKNKSAQAPETGLDYQFVTEGQALLDFFYSDKCVGNFHIFIERFRALPKNSLFYQYVYEMAVKAGVQIESWDHEFAKYNWDKPGMIPLSIQALERCLHTAGKRN